MIMKTKIRMWLAMMALITLIIIGTIVNENENDVSITFEIKFLLFSILVLLFRCLSS